MSYIDDNGNINGGKVVIHVGSALLILFVVLALVGPRYNVWKREMSGRAQLAEAKWNRTIAFEEAKAKKSAAEQLALAEIARAKGVAEANRIIGESLKSNEAYLRYLWIQGLSDGNGETIYVPTEAGLPILEASRYSRQVVEVK